MRSRLFIRACLAGVEPQCRAIQLHRVAEIAEEKAQDSRLAFLWMQRALLEEPLNEHTDAEVERLARARLWKEGRQQLGLVDFASLASTLNQLYRVANL